MATGNPVLQSYLDEIDPVAHQAVTALDAAVRAAHPDFDVAVKYHLLMYALGRDWRTWVCAVGASKKTVGLRFLYGVMLDDPLHVLRAGSSVLMTWDLDVEAPIDADAVGQYVRQAMRRYADYKANASQILADSQDAAARAGRRLSR